MRPILKAIGAEAEDLGVGWLGTQTKIFVTDSVPEPVQYRIDHVGGARIVHCGASRKAVHGVDTC